MLSLALPFPFEFKQDAETLILRMLCIADAYAFSMREWR